MTHSLLSVDDFSRFGWINCRVRRKRGAAVAQYTDIGSVAQSLQGAPFKTFAIPL